MPDQTRAPTEFVDNAGIPVLFATGACGLYIHEGVVTTTFEVLAPQHTSPPGPVRRTVIGRLAMPVPATQRMALSLIDFLKSRGFYPIPAAPPGSAANANQTRTTTEFVDNAAAPVMFATGVSGYFVHEGIVTMTFEVLAPQHSSAQNTPRRVVIGRLAAPVPATQRLATSLLDFLKSHGLDPVAAATAGYTAQ